MKWMFWSFSKIQKWTRWLTLIIGAILKISGLNQGWNWYRASGDSCPRLIKSRLLHVEKLMYGGNGPTIFFLFLTIGPTIGIYSFQEVNIYWLWWNKRILLMMIFTRYREKYNSFENCISAIILYINGSSNANLYTKLNVMT